VSELINHHMQKIIVCLTLAAFATLTSLQAGEKTAQTKATSCTQATSACCSTSTSTTSACTKSCSGAAKVAKRNTDVKGAVVLVQR
jgi:hypothetical protein